MSEKTLTQISNYAFTGNHLLQISLMKNETTDKDYKREFFAFVTLAPGEKLQNGGRTFNFDNRITLKVDLEKLLALGYALEMYAKGQGNIAGTFQIFTDATKSAYGGSNATTKTMYLKELTQKDERVLGLGFKLGQNAANQFNVSPTTALAIADICKMMANMGIVRELNKAANRPAVDSYQNKKIPTPPVPSGNAPQFNNGSGQNQQVVGEFEETLENVF